MIGIDAQIVAMAERWPTFAVSAWEGRTAIWEGTLDPVRRRYRVRVAYRPPLAIELFRIVDIQPRVQILSPALEHHPEFEDGPVPHVYWNREDPTLPYLCLFDPFNAEWSPIDLLADTTLHWTARYLYFYEGWLATGKWKGGGRHPTDEELGVDRSKAITAV